MQDESQFVLVFAVSSLIIVLILILVILFVIAYQKRVATQRIKLDEIEKVHQIQLLQATLEMQERERKRIASDLHDDIGSLLSALKINVEFLESNETNERQRSFLQKTREKLETGIVQVRQISHDIYPPVLQKLGLWEAIKELFQSINASQKIEASLHRTTDIVRLDPKIELGIYRVVQELVTNSLRHSEATHLSLTVSRLNKATQFVYADNGKGLPEETSTTGIGFLNMRSRIEAIHGKIRFESMETKGFTAFIEIEER